MPKNTQFQTSISGETPRDESTSAVHPPLSALLGFEPEKPGTPVTHYLWILRRHLWKMAAFVAACMLVTFIVSARLKPLYQSTATIDVNLQAPRGVVGQSSITAGNSEDPDIFLATQIRLIQSDAVLRPVAEQFHLLGRASQAENPNATAAQSLAEAPVSLGGLKVTRMPNTYLLLVTYRSSDPGLAADVANATAKSYLAQSYGLRIRSSTSLSSFMDKQLDELKAKMELSSQALAQYEKDMDVVNPEDKTNILSARLMQLNTEYTTAQADRVTKEAAWNAIKSGGAVAAEVSSQAEPIRKLDDALNQAQLRLAAVKAVYGVNHPEYHKAASALAELQKQVDDTQTNISSRVEIEYRQSLDREQMFKQELAEVKAEWDSINGSSFQYQRLKQDADADKALYNELITKISEAGINAGFEDNNIRIADVARPSQVPVYPDKERNVLQAFLFSTLLAIGAVLLLDLLDTTLRNPEEASRILGTDVIGALPSDALAAQQIRPPVPKGLEPAVAGQGLNSMAGNGGNPKGYSTTFNFDEAIRTIRNTILLSDFDHRLNSIMITSAGPSEGKTTTAVQLAIANAARGKKTLLVDADLRRPSVHVKFALSPRVGLSSVLNGELEWREALLPVAGIPFLTLLPSGPGSHRAADLIGQQLSELLDEFEKEYEMVIVDSPPCLAFAECLQMATAADGVLIITKAGETKRSAVLGVLTTLKRIRANVIGVVLNQVKSNTSSEGYDYYGYKYQNNYEEKRSEEKA